MTREELQLIAGRERALTILRELERTPCLVHDHALKRNQIDCSVCWIERIAKEFAAQRKEASSEKP